MSDARRDVIRTDRGPQAIGPYSQAIRAGGFVFVSGQLALDPGTGQMILGDTKAQTRQVLQNLSAILEASGTAMSKVVRSTVYLASMDDFGMMNEVYMSFFRDDPPARSTVEVSRLPRDGRVEIDVIALA